MPVFAPALGKLIILIVGGMIVLSPVGYMTSKEKVPGQPDKPIVIQQPKPHRVLTREEYLEFHESRDELREKHSDY